MVVRSVNPVRVTVKVNIEVPLLPSVIETLSMLNVGDVSSLTIVPVATPVVINAFPDAERFTVNDSVFS